MTEKQDSLSEKSPLQKGAYAHAGPNDLRTPCPMLNCLANHGYLPRDGRGARVEDFKSALVEAGLAPSLATLMSNPIFQEHIEKGSSAAAAAESVPLWRKGLGVLSDPWSLLSFVGMRPPGQVDSVGQRILNLNDVGVHEIIEHDISLTRRDYNQGDQTSVQMDLVKALLAASSDGKVVTADDLVAFRKQRIQQQREDNSAVLYGAKQHQLACGEMTFILQVFGDGNEVRCDYLRAVLEEERLPLEEGWTKKSWWSSVGIISLVRGTNKIKASLGDVLLK